MKVITMKTITLHLSKSIKKNENIYIDSFLYVNYELSVAQKICMDLITRKK